MMDIVFDIGNVICEWNPQKLVATVFSCEKDRIEAIEKIIGHEDWLKLDKGTLSLDEAISRAARRCHISEEGVKKLYEETPRSLVPIPATINVIMDLSKKGYSLYVLSNMHEHAFDYLFTTYDIWSYFSGIVISSQIKSIKPEPEIFEYLFRTYNLIPNKTVFLDDMEQNIEAAEKFGMKTILVKDPFQIKKDLFPMIGI